MTANVKLLSGGFVFIFLGLGLLAILALPNASLTLANAFIDAPVTQADQTLSLLNPTYLHTASIVERVGEIFALLSLLAGIALTASGILRKF